MHEKEDLQSLAKVEVSRKLARYVLSKDEIPCFD